MTPEQDELLQIFVRFSEGEYQDSLSRATALIRNVGPSQTLGNFITQLSQIMLISMQRLGRPHEALKLGRHILASDKGGTFTSALIKLTIGHADLSQVLAQARNDEDRCRAHYYQGLRFVTQEESAKAIVEFEESRRLPVAIVESQMAAIALQKYRN